MPPFEHLFFDLDHTLWDFDKSSEETLSELYDRYGLRSIGASSLEGFIENFLKTNYELWALYDQNKIDKDYIREKRFALTFEKLGLTPENGISSDLGRDYLNECPQKPYLIDSAEEVLQALSGDYQLHVITNGFQDSQTIKMKSSGILGYFDVIVTSECTGFKKPAPQIFQFALDQAKTSAQTSLMIGDNLATDVKGAGAIGMACVFYNPQKIPHEQKVFADIQHLSELLPLLPVTSST